jgi:hypothetical protein
MQNNEIYRVTCKCGEVIKFHSEENHPAPMVEKCPVCGEIHFRPPPRARKTLLSRILRIRNIHKIRKSTLMIWIVILGIFQELEPPLTVRQIFYALTVRNVVQKTESGYRRTAYHLKEMRRKNVIPYGHIADNTRWHIKPTTHPSMQAALKGWQKAYRRDLWANQEDYIEIWVEKDALAGVISPITEEYDVPLYVARGYGSITFIYEAAETIKKTGKPAYIYHFGDFDPSGVDAAYKIWEGLREHGANINFERAAITEEQILRLNLPTRETKRSDPRAKRWGDKPSAELDALPAPILRDMVTECIESHIDPELLEKTKKIEELERKTLTNVSEHFGTGTKFFK